MTKGRERVNGWVHLVACMTFACVATALPRTGEACDGSRCLVTVGCAKTVVQGKAVPQVVVLPPGGGMFLLPMSVVVTCGNNCGGVCNQPTAVIAATTTVTLCPGPAPCAAGCASPIPPVVVAAPAGMPLPACNNRGAFTEYLVPIVVPPAVFGMFCVTATTTFTFTGGMMLTAVGDQVVCIVPELPGQPGVPRLDLQLDLTGLSNSMARCAPGDQVNFAYTITNNDPTETFTVPAGNAVATSRAISRLPGSIPPGMNEADGVFAISGPTADDFPIAFDPIGCIALPNPATFVQPPIARPGVITIPPLSSVTVFLGIRSYPGCACGSAAETTFSVEGTFAPSGNPGLACAGTALFVDTLVPFPGGQFPCISCGFPANDCNNNGVYDPDDIYVNQTSTDLNLDTVPDDCQPSGPLSDECANATPVVLGTNVISNLGATTSANPDPVGCPNFFGANDNDVWHTFLATGTGNHEFNTCGAGATGWDTDLTLYSGTCGALTLVACNGDGNGLVGCQIFYSRLQAPLTAGVTYTVRIGGFDATEVGTGELNITALGVEICGDGLDNDGDGATDCNDGDCAGVMACQVPDFCAGATLVACGAVVMDDTSLYTADTLPVCGTTNGTGGGRWYRFAGNGDQVTLSTCSAATTYDTKIRVWSGTCGALTCVAGNDDAACGFGGLLTTVSFLTTSGVNYFILVHGFGAAQGIFEMSVTCVTPGVEICNDGLDNDLDGLIDCVDMLDCPSGMAPCIEICNDALDNDGDGLVDCLDSDCNPGPFCMTPANDLCGTPSPAVAGLNSFDTTLANTDGLGVDIATCVGWAGADPIIHRDLWYTYMVANTGMVQVSTCNIGNIDTRIAVWAGGVACPPVPGTDIPLGCNDDGAGCANFTSIVNFSGMAGQTILIQLGGFTATTVGAGQFSITEAGAENCTDLVDNDFDGLTDCADPDCAGIPPCPAAPANDNCAMAIVVAQGMPAATGNVMGATADGTSTCGASTGNPDVWYSFTAPTAGNYLFDTCGTHDAPGLDLGMDTVVNAFDMCGGLELACNDDAGAPCAGLDAGIFRDSSISVAMTMGQTVLIRVSHFGGVIANGAFVLNIGQDCGNLGTVTCSYNCATDDVTITWTSNPQATVGYNIFENGVMIGSALAGASSFTYGTPAVGTNTYTVEWACALGGMGTTGSCTVTVQPPIVIAPATTDLILALEGLQSAGVGLVNSSAALSTALTANGRTVQTISPVNFDTLISSGCLNLSTVDTIWVMTGTFPDDYRITVGEGDALAAAGANGAGMYFEAGDHWGFIHVVSMLDGRDGVDPAGSLDGNDLFVSMNGANAPIAGLLLAPNANVAYTQDQAGNDFTDQLAVTGGDAPGVTSAEVIWTDVTAGYNVGVIALNAVGGAMISTSWEFGGYGGNQNALALDYLDALGRSGPVGDMFKRGDCNNDAGFNIADAVYVLGFLFPGANPPNVLNCRDACDGNNDGGINIADAVAILAALFGMPATPLPAPFLVCGLDTGMDVLDCLNYNATMAGCP